MHAQASNVKMPNKHRHPCIAGGLGTATPQQVKQQQQQRARQQVPRSLPEGSLDVSRVADLIASQPLDDEREWSRASLCSACPNDNTEEMMMVHVVCVQFCGGKKTFTG